MKSLIIAPQWIGDAVMTEPLLRRLGERGESLTVFAVPWVAPIYRAMKHIPGLKTIVDVPFKHGGLEWQERRGLAARIRVGEWGNIDRAYVLPNSLKSALVPWFADIPERIGYTGEMRYGLLTQRLPNPPRGARGAMVAHYLALAGEDAKAASQRGTDSVTPLLTIDNPFLAFGITPQLFAVRVGPDPHRFTNIHPKTYTVIAPGAEFGSAKRWPEHHFAELIAGLGHPAVLVGSSREQGLCEAIRSQALQIAPHSAILNLAGLTSLTDAMDLIATAKNMVSNDSGLMHVAAAFGIPQVAIFGSSDPHHTPPFNKKAKVLWLKDIEGLDCSPCFKRECPLRGQAHLRCLNAIEPPQVMRALHEAALR